MSVKVPPISTPARKDFMRRRPYPLARLREREGPVAQRWEGKGRTTTDRPHPSPGFARSHPRPLAGEGNGRVCSFRRETPAVSRGLAPVAGNAHLLAQRGGRRVVYDVAGDHHAIIFPRGFKADELIAHILQNQRRVAV